MIMSLTRRELLFTATAAAAAHAQAAGSLPSLCIFSKHLADLNYDELGKAAKEFGFDGVDLTVRPKGHVLPERVAEDLPRAVEQIRGHGVSVPMVTTGLTTPSDPAARPTLSTAARLKVPFFKPGYMYYKEDDIEKRLAQAKKDTEGLVALGKQYGIVAGFHNHSGPYVGTAVWDIRAVIADSDPKWIGYYFDPCHATAEGGVAGWLVALRLALPRMKMVALKDFYWEKRDGRWRMKMCALGEGMVDFPKVFSMLAAARFTGPISLHVEYDTRDEKAAIAHDLEFMKKQVRGAYGA
jgi:L-ribulose-5-phosphate 3-epimerase